MTNDERLKLLQDICTNGFSMVADALRTALRESSEHAGEALEQVGVSGRLDKALLTLDEWLKQQVKSGVDVPVTDVNEPHEDPVADSNSSE